MGVSGKCVNLTNFAMSENQQRQKNYKNNHISTVVQLIKLFPTWVQVTNFNTTVEVYGD